MGYGNRKGLSGLTTLIIFIALVIVAAIAAIVLLQTAESLQSQAIATGKESEKQVSSQLLIIKIIGVVKNNTTVDRFRIILKPAPGSANIWLEDTFINFSDGTVFKTGIMFDSPLDETTYLNTEQDVNANATDQNEYTLLWYGRSINFNNRDSIDAEQSVELFYASGDVTANSPVFFEIIPSTGAPSFAEFRMPVAFDTNMVQLFP